MDGSVQCRPDASEGHPLLADMAQASSPAGLQQAIAGILQVRQPALYDLTYARRQRLSIIAEALPPALVSHFSSCPPDSPPTAGSASAIHIIPCPERRDLARASAERRNTGQSGVSGQYEVSYGGEAFGADAADAQ